MTIASTPTPTPPTTDAASLLAGSPYVSYSYAYPHKSAYRPFDPPLPLAEVWADEPREANFLYLHVPFCEYRCGFCNLFTQSNPAAELPGRYVEQLRVEAERVLAAIGDRAYARLAIGGGTPTFLSLDELQELFAVITVMGADPRRVPVSCESSPATLDAERLAFLREQGVDRLSMGVQSFDDDESGRLGRPQKRVEVDRALGLIADVDFPTVNLDLVYGGEGQTVAGFAHSVRTAIDFAPREVFLYPLYVRPLTGLGRRGRAFDDADWDELRIQQYRTGREWLLDAGYEQISMRMFRRPGPSTLDPCPDRYRCQEDGMVGLGCGSRSYTRTLHYSGDYAVGQTGVRAILGEYLAATPEAFDHARFGTRLTDEDERRRYVILSLLQSEGLDRSDYAARFDCDPLVDLPELADLERVQLATMETGRITLTAAGMERSDAIGPWLYSVDVRLRSEAYECR